MYWKIVRITKKKKLQLLILKKQTKKTFESRGHTVLDKENISKHKKYKKKKKKK